MLEIRFHGRGGQGTVVASNILASAFFKEGKYAQAFPFFGGERRGAPVAAFTRVDNKRIRLRCQIYFPDQVIVLDPTLIQVVDVTAGLKEGGLILANSDKGPKELGLGGRFRLATVDASAIATRHGLGTKSAPIVNTAILGAYSRASGLVSIQAVLEAVQEEVPAKREENAAAVMEAYHQVWL
ncbi:MAG: 2-oxoacid:acceptor oxidoreductase family protein [candidate division NC10 bacterium]|nr:2-oxoacid:acceptor oxidoreductase family protein [candidate division NC10 bacterium]